MKTELLEEVRGWLIDRAVGLIGPDQLVAVADRKIEGLEDPPDYLLCVSLGESLDYVPRLDLLRERVTDADSALLARRILDAKADGRIDFDAIGSIALVLTRLLAETEESYEKFMWISDELHLAEIGVKDGDRSHRDVSNVLEEIANLDRN